MQCRLYEYTLWCVTMLNAYNGLDNGELYKETLGKQE